MNLPMLYVIAGPNGVGKTSSAYDVIPQNTPVINSDEIAKQVRTAGLVTANTQEYSNREAQAILQKYLEAKTSFAIETNLADEETWKFLKGIKAIGYRVHLAYLSTDDLSLLHRRIKERALRGEHFVRPDIVEERYFTGLKLLHHYIGIPDAVELLDNSTMLRRIAQKEDDAYRITAAQLPTWFSTYLATHFSPATKETPTKDLSSIEDVRDRYKASKKDPSAN